MVKEVEAYGKMRVFCCISVLDADILFNAEKEVISNEARVQKMRDEKRDIYDIRKQVYIVISSFNSRLLTTCE
jgi:hypothetical protein